MWNIQLIDILSLGILGIASFFQNMMFTWSSRSRNSGDPSYHRHAAWGSNGIWFICHFLILRQVWSTLTSGNWLVLFLTLIIYTICTAEGSVLMMKILLKKEKGSKRVGAKKKFN